MRCLAAKQQLSRALVRTASGRNSRRPTAAAHRARTMSCFCHADMYPHGLKSLSPDTTVEKTLQRLGSQFDMVPLPAEGSMYIKPASVMFELDGKRRRWDVIEAHSSVACVLYHKDMDAFLLVLQFRPAVYACRVREAKEAGQPAPDRTAGFTIELCAGLIDKAKSLQDMYLKQQPHFTGFTIELCAGLIDKAKSLQEIVSEEILEEVGYRVEPQEVHALSAAVAAAGVNGSTSHQFYAMVDNSRCVSKGGGLVHSGEAIEVLALPFNSVPDFVTDAKVAKSTGLMFGLLWAHGALLSGQWPGRESLETQPLLLQPVLPS